MRYLAHKNLTFLLLATIVFSCKEDPIVPPPPGEEGELITSIYITFTDSATQNSKIVKFRDLDGAGGNKPQVDSIILDAQHTYFAELLLLDESKSPVDTISNEILKEANDHQFFYFPTAGVTITYADHDTNNPPLPFGLKTKWSAGAGGTGSLRLLLKHQPGTKNGTETPGETDIEVYFPLLIKS